MAQLFHRSTNSISKISIVATVLGVGALITFAYTMDRGRYITDVKWSKISRFRSATSTTSPTTASTAATATPR